MPYEPFIIAGLISLGLWPLLVSVTGTAWRGSVAAGLVILVVGAILHSLSTRTVSVNEQVRAAQNHPVEVRRDGYVSSRTCRSCHPHQYATWHASYHRTMTQLATPQTVLGRFEDVRLVHHGRSLGLARLGDQFWVDMPTRGWKGADQDRPQVRKQVVMTTGAHHYQVYWVPTGKSRVVEDFPFVYLTKEQQWIPRGAAFLGPEEKTEEMGGTWNTNCIKCHVTHGVPEATDFHLMETEVGEFGISCEACHGPATDHVQINRDPRRRYRLHASAEPDGTIVHPARLSHQRSSEVCGQCHGIHIFHKDDDWWKWVDDGLPYRPGDELAKTRLTVRNNEDVLNRTAMKNRMQSNPNYMKQLFWSDGMVRVSGREYNGLLETACYQQGQMSCLSCHIMHKAADDPRSLLEWSDDQLKLGMRGNLACAECHPQFTEERALAEHTHHRPDSSGSLCYNCHMPYTTYGLLKAIRSHQVSVPDIGASVRTGRPNACNQCHLDQTLGWASSHLADWYGLSSPQLSQDQQTVAASVLWLLTGDAGQRAIMAWSMGWEPAQEASGRDWIGPLLAQLLDDPYQAVRFIAYRSLKSLPQFHDFEYQFLDSPSQRTAAVQRARRVWKRHKTNHPSFARDEVLLDAHGMVHDPTLTRLLKQRDDTPVELHE